MKFETQYEIFPAGAFGVPDGSTKVVPTNKQGPTTIQGDPLDPLTLLPSGWGTMPVYRPDSAALSMSFDMDTLHIQLRDNFAIVTGDAQDIGEAQVLGRKVISRLLQVLSVIRGVPFSCERHVIRMADGNHLARQSPAWVRMLSYDLVKLRDDIRRARDLSSTNDPVFNRAVAYLNFALYLNDNMVGWSVGYWYEALNPFISSALLNIWKAISTVVGDTTKGDPIDARCKALGFPIDFYERELLPIRDVRNDFDVAHYDLNEKRIEAARALVQNSGDLAKRVVLAYAEYLQKGGTPFNQ